MTTTRWIDTTNFRKLMLPDGRRAADLDRFELAHELEAIGVPTISPESGLHDSLSSYEAFLKSRNPSNPFQWAPTSGEVPASPPVPAAATRARAR